MGRHTAVDGRIPLIVEVSELATDHYPEADPVPALTREGSKYLILRLLRPMLKSEASHLLEHRRMQQVMRLQPVARPSRSRPGQLVAENLPNGTRRLVGMTGEI